MYNPRLLARSLGALSILAAVAACGNPSIDVQWTIEGDEATSDVCTDVAADGIELVATGPANVDEGTAGEVVTVTAACDDGQATIELPSPDATLLVKLLRGDVFAGVAGPFDIGEAGGGLLAENEMYGADIEMLTARFTAEFVVVDRPICELGPSAIDVSFRAVDQGVESTEVGEGSVSCSGDRALFVYDDAQIGKAYLVVASTTIDGKSYSTPSGGARVMIDRAVLNHDVSLSEQ